MLRLIRLDGATTTPTEKKPEKPVDKPHSLRYTVDMMTQEQLHQDSLRLGRIFRALYLEGRDNQAILDALEDYKDARRKLDPVQRGARYGAAEAYMITQGEID